LGSRSTTGALLFTASTWTIAVAVLLSLMPSLTTTSTIRVTFEGSMLPLLNVICCDALWYVAAAATPVSVMTLVPEPETTMPAGGAPSKIRTSPVCGLVSVIVADARLGLSGSMIRMSVSARTTGGPPSVNPVR
jgi:hypothetical protein